MRGNTALLYVSSINDFAKALTSDYKRYGIKRGQIYSNGAAYLTKYNAVHFIYICFEFNICYSSCSSKETSYRRYTIQLIELGTPTAPFTQGSILVTF
jgi:hypothetical protein